MSYGLGKLGGRLVVAAALCFSTLCPAAGAQAHGAAASQGSVTATAPQPGESASSSTAGTLVDQVVAIVNSDLVLESDIREERDLEAFEPLSPQPVSRDAVVERLIDRELILQQAKLQPDDMVTRAEAELQLVQVRKDIPACKQYHCETEAGWQSFIAAQGLTKDELVTLWQQRMEILKFIEIRFRSGILIDPAAIKAYYDKTLLPEYAKRNATAPRLDVISARVQEILLQQQVTSLLGDWLQTLKAEGSVRVIRPGEVQP